MAYMSGADNRTSNVAPSTVVFTYTGENVTDNFTQSIMASTDGPDSLTGDVTQSLTAFTAKRNNMIDNLTQSITAFTGRGDNNTVNNLTQYIIASTDEGDYMADNLTQSIIASTDEGDNLTDNVTQYITTYANTPIVSDHNPYTTTEVERIVEAVLLGAIGVIGIFLNILLITDIVYNKTLRKPLHYMLCMIAFLDICVVVPCPLIAYGTWRDRWDLPHWLCEFVGCIQGWGLSSSIVCHSLIAFNCFLKCFFQSKIARRLRTIKSMMIIFIISWVIVFFVITLPNTPIVNYVRPDYAPVFGMCVSAWVAPDATNIELFIYWAFGSTVVLPYLFALVFYSKVLWVIRRRLDTFDTASTRRQFVKACKRLGTLFFVFTFCYLPHTCYSLADPYILHIPAWGIRGLFIIFMCHTCINPFICLFKMDDIYEGLLHLCLKKRRMPSSFKHLEKRKSRSNIVVQENRIREILSTRTIEISNLTSGNCNVVPNGPPGVPDDSIQTHM